MEIMGVITSTLLRYAHGTEDPPGEVEFVPHTMGNIVEIPGDGTLCFQHRDGQKVILTYPDWSMTVEPDTERGGLTALFELLRPLRLNDAIEITEAASRLGETLEQAAAEHGVTLRAVMRSM